MLSFVVVVAFTLGFDPAEEAPEPSPPIAVVPLAPTTAPTAPTARVVTVEPTPADPADPASPIDVVVPGVAPPEPAAPPKAPAFIDPAEVGGEEPDAPRAPDVPDDVRPAPRTTSPRPPRVPENLDARDAATVGAAAGGAACLGACIPLGCAAACPPMLLASPITSCAAGVIAGTSTHIALNDAADQQPVLVAVLTAAGVLLGAVAGGGLGVIAAFADRNLGDPFTLGLVGIVLAAPTLGVIGAGIGAASVELVPAGAAEEAPTTTLARSVALQDSMIE